MHTQPSHHADETQTVAAGADFALVSMSVGGLPNSVLVQLMRSRFGKRPVFSLYTLYREGPMTFEATVRFDTAGSTLSLEQELMAFVTRAAYRRAVLMPLTRQVWRHFNR